MLNLNKVIQYVLIFQVYLINYILKMNKHLLLDLVLLIKLMIYINGELVFNMTLDQYNKVLTQRSYSSIVSKEDEPCQSSISTKNMWSISAYNDII